MLIFSGKCGFGGGVSGGIFPHFCGKILHAGPRMSGPGDGEEPQAEGGTRVDDFGRPFFRLTDETFHR